MAKLELPVRAFITDFCRRAFPNRDFGRGSAINDLVITPLAVTHQPLRHEIDAIKVSQSVANYAYMPRADMDALAANWGRTRQTGGRAEGVVRLYFDVAADFQLNYLEFLGSDGVRFVLKAPVRITSTELLQGRLRDAGLTLYAYDVEVISTALGNRYLVPANTVQVVVNPPPNLVRCNNPSDFAVTSPDETNYDILNGLYRNLGLRNLVNRQSIRAVLFDSFPGIVDIFVAGADHTKMVRDLQTVQIAGREVQIHVGGAADVWLNTLNLAQRTQNFSYLPSSQQVKLVSGAQAAETAVAADFNGAFYSLDGGFGTAETTLDESMALQVEEGPVVREGFVISEKQNGEYAVAENDLLRGRSGFTLPVYNAALGGSSRDSMYWYDPDAPSFTDAGVTRGDMFTRAESRDKIANVGGNTLALAPSPTFKTKVTVQADASEYDSVLLVDAVALVSPNDTLYVTEGDATGTYRVASVTAPGTITLDTPILKVQSNDNPEYVRGTGTAEDPYIYRLTTVTDVYVPQGSVDGLMLRPAHSPSALYRVAAVEKGATPALLVDLTGNAIGTRVSTGNITIDNGANTVTATVPALWARVGVGSRLYMTGPNTQPVLNNVVVTITSITPSGPNHVITFTPSADPTVNGSQAFTLTFYFPDNLTGTSPTTTLELTQQLRGALPVSSEAFVYSASSGVRTSAVLNTEVPGCVYAGSLASAWNTKIMPVSAAAFATVQNGDPISNDDNWATRASQTATLTVSAHNYSVGQLVRLDITTSSGSSSFHARVDSVPNVNTVVLRYTTPTLTGTFVSGTVTADVLEAPGIAAVLNQTTSQRYLLCIEGTGIEADEAARHGSDGKLLTMLVRTTDHSDRVRVSPPISGVFPAGAKFAVVPIDIAEGFSAGSATLTTSTTGTLSYPWEQGFGDAVGCLLVHPTDPDTHAAGITSSSRVSTRRLLFKPGLPYFTVTFAPGNFLAASAGYVGQPVTQGTVNGVLAAVDTTSLRWIITVADASIVFNNGSPIQVAGQTVAMTGATVASSGTDRWGYWGPTTPLLGKVVRQGSSRGTLMAVGTVGLTHYWDVKPDTAGDTFDSTTDVAFIDSGSGFPDDNWANTDNGAAVGTAPSRQQGYLAAPASPEQVQTSSSATVTLTETMAAATCVLLPRFPTRGGLFNAGNFEAPYPGLSAKAFAPYGTPIEPSTSNNNPAALALPLGPDAGLLTIDATDAADTSKIPVTGEAFYIDIPGFGSERLIQASAITAAPSGLTNTLLTFPLTANLGLWAAPDAAVAWTVNGETTFHKIVYTPMGATTTQLIVTSAPAIPTSGAVAVKIVRAHITPFFVLATNQLESYRVSKPPKFGEVIAERTDGASIAGSRTLSFVASIRDAIGGMSRRGSLNEIQALIVSGPDASADVYRVQRIVNDNDILLDRPLTATTGGIRVVFTARSRADELEQWTTATVVAGGNLQVTAAFMDADMHGPDVGPWARQYHMFVYQNGQLTGPWMVESGSEGVVQNNAMAGRLLNTRRSTVTFTVSTASAPPPPSGTYTVLFRAIDRTMCTPRPGKVVNSYSYYVGSYMTLPVVRVVRAEVIDPTSGTTLREVPWSISTDAPGLRYSAKEENYLRIEDITAIYQPIRITYVCDPSIGTVDSFINDPERRIVNSNYLVKRMETINVDLSVSVRSTLTADEINRRIAQFINTLPSTRRLSKDLLIQHLYSETLVSGIELTTFVLSGRYDRVDGEPILSVDVPELFGAETACYVAGIINVTVV